MRPSKTVALLSIMLAMLLATPAVLSQGNPNPGSGVMPPHSKAFGKTYGEWQAAWQQWSMSLPYTAHPLLDTGPVSTGQSGHVWFLGGSYSGGPAGPVVRNVTIPPGKALFFPIINVFWDPVGMDPVPTVEELQALAAGAINSVNYATCSIDGVALNGIGVSGPYRHPSAVYSYQVLLDDSLFEYFGAMPPYVAGMIVDYCVDDGIYIMLAPLSVGSHVIHFTAGITGWFALDVTYNITVAP